MLKEKYPRVFAFHTKREKSYKWTLVVIHILLALVCNRYNSYITLWATFAFFASVFLVLKSNPSIGYSYCLAGYFVSFEVILRLLRSDLFWEFGKYSTTVLLLLGMFIGKKVKSKSGIFMIYFLLLIPAIFAIDYINYDVSVKDAISSKLSGPFLLCISGIFFFDKKMTLTRLKDLLFCLFLPFVTLAITLAKNLNSLSSDAFSNASNFQLTNNFGPNQVSTILGFGICVFYLSMVTHDKILPFKIMDWALVVSLMIFSLLTFSRGGVLSAVASIILAMISGKFQLKQGSFKTYLNLTLIILGSIGTFYYVDGFTKGALKERYEYGKSEKFDNSTGNIKNKYLTGRDELFKADLNMFKDNYIYGIGVGMSRFRRSDYGTTGSMSEVTEHTEFSRAIAEHGLFGIASIATLLYLVVTRIILIRPGPSRVFFVLMCSYCLLTLAHSAMRLAIAGFLFGLAFIKIYEDENSNSYI